MQTFGRHSDFRFKSVQYIFNYIGSTYSSAHDIYADSTACEQQAAHFSVIGYLAAECLEIALDRMAHVEARAEARAEGARRGGGATCQNHKKCHVFSK